MKISLTLIAFLFLTACTVDQVTLTLELAVDAAATVAQVAAPQDSVYINLALTCLDSATAELGSTDTNIQKGTVILADCAKAAGADIPGLTPLGKALANALSNFLIQIKSLYGAVTGNVALSFNTKIPSLDKARLARIKVKLLAIPRRNG